MQTKRLLLINGSPRKKGTSFSFARTLKMLAEEAGCEAEIVHGIDYFDGKDTMNHLGELLKQSDIIAVSAPIYADALPYPAIWLLEQLAAEHNEVLRGKSFFAVGQCAFPDITRVTPILDTCRCFAAEMGMRWHGGLAYGGGVLLNGALLEDLGKKGEKLIQSFRLALQAIINGDEIPEKAQKLITVKIPKIFYRPLVAMLNQRARTLARENGNVDITAKVYLE